MIIQQFVSRPDSIKAKIHQDAFEFGGSALFSSEEIPFSGRTSRFFAEKLVQLLVERITQITTHSKTTKPSELFHICELGAGNGLLSKRMLDILNSQHPKIYTQLHFHVTDGSSSLVRDMQTSELFAEHTGHVTIEQLDASKPLFAYKPLVIFFTNLIDSMPAKQIQCIDSKPHEYKVQTTLRSDTALYEWQDTQPAVLNDLAAIGSLLTDGPTSLRLKFAPQLLHQLEEEKKLFLIDLRKWPTSEATDLLSYLSALKTSSTPLFNYSYQARVMLKLCWQQMHPDGFLVTSDFGTVSHNYLDTNLEQRFGLISCNAVDFLAVKQTCPATAQVLHTTHPPGNTQEFIVNLSTTFLFDAAAVTQFSTTHIDEEVTLFLTKAEQLLFAPTPPKDVVEQLNELFALLSPDSQTDYRLLNDVSYFLLQQRHFEAARFYCQKLKDYFNDQVGIHYYLILGVAHQELGEYDQAEQVFKAAINANKGFMAWAHLANLYLLQKKFDQYIPAAKEYLVRSRNHDQIKTIQSIALAEQKRMY